MNSHPVAQRLVNFCRAPLTKHVECSAVCADDHPPENLVARSATQRLKGLRVEHFVRPPVHVEFHFLAPVDPVCVLVKPDLSGEGAAAGVIVSAATGSRQQPVQVSRGSVRGEGAVLLMRNRVYERRHGRTELSSYSRVRGSGLSQADTEREPVEETLKDMRNIKYLRITVNYFPGPRPVSLKVVEVWGTVGACLLGEDQLTALAQLDEGVGHGMMCGHIPGGGPTECLLLQRLVGHSSGEQTGEKTGEQTAGEEESERVSAACGAYSAPLRAWEEGVIGNESHSSVCPPGQREFSDSCCRVSGQSVQSVCSSGDESKLTGGADSVCAATQQSCVGEFDFCGNCASGGKQTSPSDSSGPRSSLRVPERFLDEITCEIMVLPMLLPSGHYVDRSTLDRLQHTDSVYGRPPSDPFTGVAFSEHAEPQFSVNLKQQIDSFVSRHRSRLLRDKASSLPGQTLGSAADIALHLSSTKAPVSELGVGLKRGRDATSVCSDSLSLPPPTKKMATDEAKRGEGSGYMQLPSSAPATTDPLPSSSNTCGDISTVSEGHRDAQREVVGTGSCAHELELTSSLDRDLKDLLHN